MPPERLTGFDQLRGRQLAIALTGVLLGLLLSALNQTIVGTALPRIVAELGGLEQYAWVATAYLLTGTAAVPIVGKLSDIYGRKWFYIGGLLFFMLTSALCGLSQTMTQLIAFRALQGIAGGILMANAFALIGDLFPPAERGKWQGLTAAVFGIASVVGPTLGGWLTDGPGWRWVFYITLPVGFVALPVLLTGLPHIRPHERQPIDWWGATTIVGAVVPLLLAFSWAGTEYAWGSPQVTGLLALAMVMTALFLIAEHRAAQPIIPLDLFRDRTFAVSVSSMFLVGAGMFGAILYVPLFAQAVIGVSATNSGIIVTPMMLGFVVSSIIIGQIMSRTGRYKWAALSGLTIMAIGMGLLSLMDVNTTTGRAIVNMVVVGIGIGMAMPTFTISVQNAFPTSRLGVVTAATQFFRQIGGTIGIALMGAFITARLRTELQTNLTPDVALAIPADVMDTTNPQVLADPEGLDQLQTELAHLPEGAMLFTELIQAMRFSLATAIHEVFLISTAVGVVAILIALFLRELPLRKRGEDVPETVSKKAPDSPATPFAAGGHHTRLSATVSRARDDI